MKKKNTLTILSKEDSGTELEIIIVITFNITKINIKKIFRKKEIQKYIANKVLMELLYKNRNSQF